MKIVLILLLSLAVIANSQYTNPVQGQRDSPDPGVLWDQGSQKFYAVTTGGWDGHSFPIWVSNDLTRWEQKGWGLLINPTWASRDFWAPEIHIVGRQYNLYYTGRNLNGKLCIGVAHSDNILGPYIDIEKPLIQQQNMGLIDATFVSDNGKNYLVYKTDGNDVRKPTQIFAVQLAADGLSVIQPNRHLLFRDSLSFEHGIVEAPWVVIRNGFYYVFYSASGYADSSYSVSVARSRDLLGGYVKYNQPILYTKKQQDDRSSQGPGHCSVLKLKNEKYVMVYHAWPHKKNPQKRFMMLDTVSWNNDWPFVGEPSQTPQPNPI